MERWTGQAAGTARQESRSIVGGSIVRNYYRDDIDPNGALTQVNSLASAAIPNLPPGTLPPVILPFDPTGTTPVCLVALDSEDGTGVDPVRHGPLRGPQHDHGRARRGRPGRLRRQAAGGPGLPGPREDAGPQPVAARRDERHRQLQHLPADRRRQVRQASTTPSTPTRCTNWSSAWATSPSRPRTARPSSSRTWPRRRTPA